MRFSCYFKVKMGIEYDLEGKALRPKVHRKTDGIEIEKSYAGGSKGKNNPPQVCLPDPLLPSRAARLPLS